MKKIVKITAAVLAALMLALTLAACGEEKNEASAADDTEAVKALIAECESACRALDIERVLKTLDPKIQKAVKKISDIAGKLTGSGGLSFEALINAVGGGEIDTSGEEINDVLSALSVDVTEVVLNGSKAEAKTTLSVSGGVNFSKNIVIKCKKSGGKWYISGVNIPKEEN